MTTPNPPTNLSVSARTIDSFLASWSPPDSGPVPDSYEYRIDVGMSFDVGTDTEVTVYVPMVGQSVSVDVRSVFEGLFSDWTPIVQSHGGTPLAFNNEQAVALYVGNANVTKGYLGAAPFFDVEPPVSAGFGSSPFGSTPFGT